jgi:hypothetical protein
MKYLVLIDYTDNDDPIRSPHGLSRLLAFGRELDGLVTAAGVERLTPVLWECRAPRGYCVFEADDPALLEPLTGRFGHKPKISVRQVRFLDELLTLGEEVLADLRVRATR